MRQSSRSRSKFGVLTLAITLLLVQLGGIWHLTREEHVRCAEHGEWTEVSPRTPCAAAASTRSGPHVDGTAPESGAHEHCALVMASRTRGIVWQGDLVFLQPEPLIAEVSTPRVDPVDSGLALYLLAPKQSPPC